MITGIKPTGVSPRTGLSPYNIGATVSANHAVKAEQLYDAFQCHCVVKGTEGRVREMTAQISQQVRIRPTKHELSLLQQEVKDGTHQPDAGRIASRMLLMDLQEV